MPGQAGHCHRGKQADDALSPLLYDLTSLQREANGRFGFRAKNTLALAQALYERHKVLTYPRTDSRALPEDYIATVKKTLGDVARHRLRGRLPTQILQKRLGHARTSAFSTTPRSPITSPSSRPRLRPKHLTEPEQKLYDLVTKRFLAVFYPAAEFLVTTRITRVEGEPFKSEGKVHGQRRLDGGLWQGGANRGSSAAAWRRCSRTKRSKPATIEVQRHPDQAAAALHRSHAAVARWKARANWSRTRNCARR